jgi:hypothetical protein
MIVQKLTGARQRIRAKSGRCEGRKPYGTRSGDAEVVERMTKMRQQGTAVDTIAETLNTEGIKPRAGQKWYANSVYRILKAAGPL